MDRLSEGERRTAGETWLARAEVTFAALDSTWHLRRRPLYGKRQWGCVTRVEALWPFVATWTAASTLGAVQASALATARLNEMPAGLAAYASRRGVPPGEAAFGFHPGTVPLIGHGGAPFYDDNAWLTLCLLREHRRSGDEAMLALARRTGAFVVEGWSDQQSWAHPGGIRWRSGPTDTSRNTCANGPAIQACVLLAQRTGDVVWLDWAERIYRWTVTALRLDTDLFADRIDPSGRVDPAIWSYNQGTMIGAGTLLAEATNERAYLTDAATTARAALAHFQLGELLAQPIQFVAVFARNLLFSASRVGLDEAGQVIVKYGESLWQRRDVEAMMLASRDRSSLNSAAGTVEVFALLGASPAIP